MGKISFRPQLAAAAMLSAVLAGSFPVTAFANTGKEADCICETRCGEGSVNEECPVCRNDIALCQNRGKHGGSDGICAGTRGAAHARRKYEPCG